MLSGYGNYPPPCVIIQGAPILAAIGGDAAEKFQYVQPAP